MVKFEALLKKFASQGEKTGWTYFEIPAKLANKIKPDTKKSFRIKGTIDKMKIHGVATIPMGGGDFIVAVNASMRKQLNKIHGANVIVSVEEDKAGYQLNKDFVDCLNDEPAAAAYFGKMPTSHQNYYSKWIESAKTEQTKAKRIALAVNTLAKGMNYPEMLRSQKEQ